MTNHIAFDLTRLFIGPINPTLRTIDHVDLGYARHFFGSGTETAWVFCRPLGHTLAYQCGPIRERIDCHHLGGRRLDLARARSPAAQRHSDDCRASSRSAAVFETDHSRSRAFRHNLFRGEQPRKKGAPVKSIFNSKSHLRSLFFGE